MSNRLADATSPYLRQHADNPVHWWPWCDEAFAEARRRGVPVLLSVGYATCHWCHVMARESFSDAATAEVMNELFVCIKVDREERPDVDAVYMNATVAMTGQGGWPMTCFLTPDGRPFHCGTYYPPTPRGGMPGFTQLLRAISDTWAQRPGDVDRAADAITAELQRTSAALPAGERAPDADLLAEAVAAILAGEDTAHGGFGGAPKFPPTSLLEGLLRHVERTGDPAALATVLRAAEAMAGGGMHDQLAGGFARYTVDATWTVPHFEKMAYDNALLLRVYAHLARATGDRLATRVAVQTAEFLIDRLGTAEGGFASGLDADTGQVEGETYVWTPAQLTEVLGSDDGAWAADLLTVTDAGTFEAGASVLQLRTEPDDAHRWERVRAALLTARDERVQPDRDDKVVTAWNGMAIVALTEAGLALGRTDWIDAARRCADLLLDRHLIDGRLRRSSLGGRVGDADAVLEDYAQLASGLLALHQVDADPDRLAAARDLLDTAIAAFHDDTAPGTWFDTAHDAEALVQRPRDPVDGATPSGASSIADALLTASALTDPEDSGRYRDLAEQALARGALLLEKASRSAGNWLAVAEAALHGPLQVAIAADGPGTDLERFARGAVPGGAVVVAGAPDAAPLLADRPLTAGAATAYVCRGFVCTMPVTTVGELTARLQGQGKD